MKNIAERAEPSFNGQRLKESFLSESLEFPRVLLHIRPQNPGSGAATETKSKQGNIIQGMKLNSINTGQGQMFLRPYNSASASTMASTIHVHGMLIIIS